MTLFSCKILQLPRSRRCCSRDRLDVVDGLGQPSMKSLTFRNESSRFVTSLMSDSISLRVEIVEERHLENS